MSNRGHDRERDVQRLLEREGWVTVRAAGSLGVLDVVALGRERVPQLIEVKSTAGGPYERFGPLERAMLSETAERAGADAMLAYWPPRGELRWITEPEWPR